MRRKFITDSEVEKEIEELSESPFVALARREQGLKEVCSLVRLLKSSMVKFFRTMKSNMMTGTGIVRVQI